MEYFSVEERLRLDAKILISLWLVVCAHPDGEAWVCIPLPEIWQLNCAVYLLYTSILDAHQYELFQSNLGCLILWRHFTRSRIFF